MSVRIQYLYRKTLSAIIGRFQQQIRKHDPRACGGYQVSIKKLLRQRALKGAATNNKNV